jgi:hypothetical protein
VRWPEIRKSRWAAILLIGVVVGVAGRPIGKVARHFAQHQAADAQHAFFKQAFEGLEQFGLLGIDLRLAGQVDGGPARESSEEDRDDQQLLINVRAFHERGATRGAI